MSGNEECSNIYESRKTFSDGVNQVYVDYSNFFEFWIHATWKISCLSYEFVTEA